MHRLYKALVLAGLLGYCALTFTGRAVGQGASQQVIVDGGTLIDGNGGAPVQNVQIVIQGNRISKIGKRAMRSPPALGSFEAMVNGSCRAYSTLN